MKKSFIAGLAGTLVLGLATSAFAFTDVTSSHWAQKYVDKLAELKVVNGISETAFNPNGKVTRAEFAKLIVEAKGLSKENPAKATFSDVAADKWYYGYVEAAAKAGYVNGAGEGKFNPNANITRQEIAKIIVEAAGLKADATKTLTFADAADVSEWAKGYVAVAAEKKFVEGYNNKFSAKNNATRAEAAKLTYSEMVYEGKIVEEEVVEADVITAINSESVEIGGKTYDLIGTNGDGTEYVVAGQLVTKEAFVEDTHVKFTLNASGKISKLEAGSDYKYVKGEVTEVGDDGDDYVTVDGKKVYFDTTDDDFYSAEINEDDEFLNENNPGAAPQLNKDYLIIYNSENFATYSIKLATTSNEGVLESKGKDKDGLYVYIDGKKYYFNEEDGSYKVENLSGAAYINFEAGYFATLKTDVRVEFETNSDDEITQIEDSELDLEGITKTVQVKKNGTAYDVWLPVRKKASDNFNTTVYLHTYITDDEEVSAIDDLVTDDVIDAVGVAPVAANADIDLDTDAKVYVNGTKVELYDVKGSNYVTADLNDDATQEVTKVTATNKVTFGLVESIVKSSDKVTGVKINGTEYAYEGDSNKYASSSKGYVSIIDGATGSATIEVGYLVRAILNADGDIISFSTLVDADDFDATVTATEGQLSHYSENEDGSKKIYVPTDNVEVRLSNGTYAWLTYDDDANGLDNASDSSTTTLSINGTKDFTKFVVGSKAYVLLTGNVAINENSAQVFDQTVINSAYPVRFNSDNNVLTVNNVDVYTSLTPALIFQK